MVNGPEGVSAWDVIDWQAHEQNVVRLRRRIFKATWNGDWPQVRNLQKMMLRSRSNTVGDRRGVVDASMDTRAWAYIGVPGPRTSPGWAYVTGTSVSAPLLAGLVADAAQLAGHPLGLINPALYRMRGTADGVLDITRGSSTARGVPGYPAAPGYDLPSGIGTVGSAALFVPALARPGQQR